VIEPMYNRRSTIQRDAEGVEGVGAQSAEEQQLVFVSTLFCLIGKNEKQLLNE
jgi:hypothetical protein